MVKESIMHSFHVRCDDCRTHVPRSVTEPSPTTGAPICPDCVGERRIAAEELE